MPNSLDDFPDQLDACADELRLTETYQHTVAKFYHNLAQMIRTNGVPDRYGLLEWIIEYDWP